MGALASKFRSYKSKAEMLDILEKEIKQKQRDRQYNQNKRELVKKCSIITAICVYLVLIILNLCLVVEDILIIVYPFVAIITIILILRSYTVAMRNNQYKLYTMREEKKKLLEEVKITETYVEAKKILDRYGSSEDLLYKSNMASHHNNNDLK